MFLGGATKRKIKTDADLQNDEVLGELLGQIGSSGTKKSETNLHKKAKIGGKEINKIKVASHALFLKGSINAIQLKELAGFFMKNL